MSLSDLLSFIRFWEELPLRSKQGASANEALADIRRDVTAMDPHARQRFAEIARGQYAEEETTRAQVAGRASHLLLFVGVVSTGTTIVAASLASSFLPVTVLTILVGAVLLYSCLAVAWLAVRTQQVHVWTRPGLKPKSHRSALGLEIAEAADTHFAAQQNSAVNRNVVAYLRDAQLWARVAIVSVTLLSILSVVGAATKPIGSDQATPSPAAVPSTHIADPSPTPGQVSMPLPSTDDPAGTEGPTVPLAPAASPPRPTQ